MLEEPVEILLDLATRGEIDPWDIDIIDVTDKFLEKLNEMSKPDLRISGRTLFYASTLLRMKAEGLEVEDDEDEFEEVLDDIEVEDEEGVNIEYPKLVPRIRRKSKRPVTLDELIKELSKAESVERKRTIKKYNVADSMKKVEELLMIAHDERIEEKILEIEAILDEKLKERDYLLFSELIESMNSSSIVYTYIPLLFLASKKAIWLEQEELYEDLYIRRRVHE
ncbi:MAG: segregation/condensation protein A [Halobacteriota archaeon]|nr:segregation/condensation protein A [Halobacteriota archaeon]